MKKTVIFLAFANDQEDKARYLRNLPDELRQIRSALEFAVHQGWCELIERANCTIQEIFDVFQNNRGNISIFHYGGHADGYQLLLENNAISHSLAHGVGLVQLLADEPNLQLVFLNGCTTHQQAKELTDKGVPIVIGTDNSIRDAIALQIATQFYKGIGKNFDIKSAWKNGETLIFTRYGNTARGLRLRQESSSESLPWKLYYNEVKNLDWKLYTYLNYNKRNVTRLLISGFNDEDLQMFCMLNFEEVYNNFGTSQSKKMKVIAIIDYVDKRMEFDKLLSLLADERPSQYEKYKPYY